ncbi:hypothetical protein [Nocardia sp. NPDC004711]
MAESWDLLVQVDPIEGDEVGDTAAAARLLRAQLLGIDIDAAEPVSDSELPEGAKSLSALSVTVGVRLGVAALGKVVAKIREWVAHSGRTVEVTLDGETIKITGGFPEQQDLVINAWLARHAPTA